MKVKIKELEIGDGFYLRPECDGGYYNIEIIDKNDNQVFCYKDSSYKSFCFSLDDYVYLYAEGK
jgi:hypothetical protein